MTILIDGDIILYAVGFASENRYYICSDGSKFDGAKDANSYCEQMGIDKFLVREPTEDKVWKGNLNSSIEKCMKPARSDESMAIILSGPDNFRYNLYPEYKANRKGAPKPFAYADMIEYLKDKYPVIVSQGMEADDLLGIMLSKDPERSVVVSLDKDLLMIPGQHYNWRHDQMLTVTEEEAEYTFWAQVLTGDPVDNIIGLKGIGPKKAEKLLDNRGDISYYDFCWAQYKAAKRKKGKDFELNCHLLWIKRSLSSTFKDLI